MLKAFKAVLPNNAGEFVHWGATSQDIVDTGLVLLQRDAYDVILRDLKLCQKHLLKIVREHRDTIMCGRTHVIHALPITLGYKVGVWVDELGRNIARLEEIKSRVLSVKWPGLLVLWRHNPKKV